MGKVNNMNKIRISIISAIFFFGCIAGASAQVTTAAAYFKSISEYYASLKDYEVDFDLKINKKENSGTISFMSPNFVRMDFVSPANQVICYNGEKIIMYLPENSAILEQESQYQSAGPMGLSLMSRYYTVAYEVGQAPVPLDENSSEMVIKFICYRKGGEAFRYIKVAVNAETKLVRRIEAVSNGGETFIFTFRNYRLNQGISEQRFAYTPPASANNLNNFLSSE